jgi:hypothetical protein
VNTKNPEENNIHSIDKLKLTFGVFSAYLVEKGCLKNIRFVERLKKTLFPSWSMMFKMIQTVID